MEQDPAFLNKVYPRSQEPLSKTFIKRLLVVLVLAVCIALAVLWLIETHMANKNAENILRINIEDVQQDIEDASDANLLLVTKDIAHDIDLTPDGPTPELLNKLMAYYDVSEIDIIDENGIITQSTNPRFVGFDMSSGDQSAEFLVLLDGTESYVQDYRPSAYDESISKKYAGVTLADGSFVQVAYDADRFQQDIDMQVISATHNRHAGENGYIIITNAKGQIVNDRHGNEGEMLAATGISTDDLGEEWKVFKANVYGQDSSCMHSDTEGYEVIAVLPESEVVLLRDVSVLQTGFAMVAVFLLLSIIIFLLVRILVVNNINRVNVSLAKITEGDLDEVVDVRTNLEFSLLSDDINSTVETLKRYISEAEARIDSELAVAETIQKSALPNTFPPYPDISKFDIYASMNTAREVGGDFYDFFLVDDDCNADEGKVAFAVADVSGKGVPASLFMMRAKTLIRDYLKTGIELGEVIENVNHQLCEGNDARMFVTAWVGVLDYGTGHIEYVNAGHNPPLLRQNDSGWTWLTQRSGLMLGLYDGLPYKTYSIDCQPTDMLLLYTDGVTEAFDESEECYGEDRLLALAEENHASHPFALVKSVADDVANHTGQAKQSDDITILALEVGVPPEITATMTVPASDDELWNVNAFIHEELDRRLCPVRVQNQIDIAVEELFVNICHHAYPDASPENAGTVRVKCTYSASPSSVTVEFTDSGVPFDPVAKLDAAITDDFDALDKSALGIFMVKQSVDEMSYKREGDENVATIFKKW